jgi:putative ABC transport system permease protein
VIVWGGRTSSQVGGLAAGREITVTIDDARAIRRECYFVKNVSPELRRAVAEVSAFNSANRGVVGMWPSYQDFRSLLLGEGRLVTDEDERDGRRVVILGYAARRQLFPGQPAVGASLLIKSVPYTVIGVLKEKKQNSNYSGPDNDYLFAPYSAVARDFPPPGNKPGIVRGYLDDIVFEVADPAMHEQAVVQVRTALGRAHHFEAKDKDALFIWDTMEGARQLKKIFDVCTIFFGCVAVMTLLLGGIGVMNIMLVSVTERTREIGVRKAIGATEDDIMNQFFAESAMLTAVSGSLGLAAGVGLCVAMKAVPLPDFVPHPIISLVSIVASLANAFSDHIHRGDVPGATRRRNDSSRLAALRIVAGQEEEHDSNTHQIQIDPRRRHCSSPLACGRQ